MSVARPAVGRGGQPAAEDLAHDREVGQRPRSAPGRRRGPRGSRVITSSKTSSAPVASARSRSSSRNPGVGRDQAHVGRERLGEDRRELVLRPRLRAARSGSFQGTITRVGRGRARGRPGWRGCPAWPGPSPASRQQPVDVAVVGAGELQRPVAAGGRAGEAHRAHRRLGARRGHAQHLHRRACASATSSASATSPAVGAPKLVPRAAARRPPRRSPDAAWPWISGPQEQTQST